MPLPLEFCTKVLVGIQMHQVLVHLPTTAGEFFAYWDRVRGDGVVGRTEMGGLQTMWMWFTPDRMTMASADPAAIRLEYRSPFPAAMAGEIERELPDLPELRFAIHGDEMLDRLARAAREDLPEALRVVRATTIKRIGVVAEVEIPLEAFIAMAGDSVLGVAGVNVGQLDELQFRSVVTLPHSEGNRRRMITSFDGRDLPSAQLNRHVPPTAERVTVLTVDYQEFFDPILHVPQSRDAARRGGVDLGAVMADVVRRAREAWNGIY